MTVGELMNILKDHDPDANVGFCSAMGAHEEHPIDFVSVRTEVERSVGWSYREASDTDGDVILLAERHPMHRRRIFPHSMERRSA